jgi:hypothetical protein
MTLTLYRPPPYFKKQSVSLRFDTLGLPVFQLSSASDLFQDINEQLHADIYYFIYIFICSIYKRIFLSVYGGREEWRVCTHTTT